MIDNIGIIELEGMEFKAYHGVLQSEKDNGNLFIVDFRGEVDMTRAVETDRIEDALDYSLIYNAVVKEMKTHSDLLEHIAGRIVKSIAAECPQLVSFSVRVSKRRPPVEGSVQWSRITLSYK